MFTDVHECSHFSNELRPRWEISPPNPEKSCLICKNNESCLCFLTFWRCRLHFMALCINTHGFNNLSSSPAIDPVGHTPPFLISRSAWGSAFSMSFHIYILQYIFKYKGSAATSSIKSVCPSAIHWSL